MAVEMFLKIGDIKGESQDAKHKDEIVVASWTWGLAQSGTTLSGAGAGAGKVLLQALVFTHAIDKASPNLMKACAKGQHIRDATLSVHKGGGQPQDYLIIKMTDVLVNAVQTGMQSGQTGDLENVTLSFAMVAFEYKAQQPTGALDPAVTFTWNLKTNAEV
jgi:type VI secretion system secreted protein Hcp